MERAIWILLVTLSNQRLYVSPGNPFVSAVRVEGGPDVADRRIVEQASPGDLAITADIPLAAAFVGEEFTAENVGERLSIRMVVQPRRGEGRRWAESLKRPPRPVGPRKPAGRGPRAGQQPANLAWNGRSRRTGNDE